jgi:alkylation response protein AidB-like acyl-CoA dehydrogenase
VDFRYPREAEAFRAELRTWLEAHLPDDLRGSGWDPDPAPERFERLRWWARTLADAGYAAIAWPREWGGRGASVMEQVVYAEEVDRAEAPGPFNPIGISNIAPAIMTWGTDDQKARFLPRMRQADDFWCQGFSEPDAGSDLASLSTTAVRDGDGWVVSGQKVWMTMGHVANWCELLARTNPDAPKHQGITCFLVDLTAPGVEARPITTISGDRDFSELFFTDVRVPGSAVLGPVDEGWRVAMTTLTHERGNVVDLHLGLRRRIRRLVEVARATPARDGGTVLDDPVVRHALARVHLEGELLKLLSDRVVSGALHGRELGPEGSLSKLVWSETEQHLAEVTGLVLGPDGLAGDWGRWRVNARGYSIAGGTTQVNKNIVAQRVLGLPRAT